MITQFEKYKQIDILNKPKFKIGDYVIAPNYIYPNDIYTDELTREMVEYIQNNVGQIESSNFDSFMEEYVYLVKYDDDDDIVFYTDDWTILIEESEIRLANKKEKDAFLLKRNQKKFNV